MLKDMNAEPNRIVAYCDKCDCEICEGYDYYDFGTFVICEDCISDFRKNAEYEEPDGEI